MTKITNRKVPDQLKTFQINGRNLKRISNRFVNEKPSVMRSLP